MILSMALATSVVTQPQLGVGQAKINWNKFSSSVLLEVKRDKNVFTCTGVLIDKDVVLTAAHCIQGISSGRVILDFAYDPDTTNDIGFTNHLIHPLYNKNVSNYAHDLAIVYLERKVSHITPAQISWNPNISNFNRMERIGFGGRNHHNVRTWTNPKVFNVERNGRVVCFEDEYSVIGDSGGPIYSVAGNTTQLVAIHSTLEGDNKTYGVYLPYYKDWIQRYL